MRPLLLLLILLPACQSSDPFAEIAGVEYIEQVPIAYRGWIRTDRTGLVRPTAADYVHGPSGI